MTYNDMPVIIPVLATAYLLTVYVLLILAERTVKSSRYIANSATEGGGHYVSADSISGGNELEKTPTPTVSEVTLR
ncbi:hypothetical protein [Limnofasciculus baicalensis]|uniref:Uncharacterized protein n=1 Tax=Limnofasciculus baicalensis BBK-W-15 TaxID=2699891 RepID=A0AAE3GRI1_9CYAN|nr:hypothetical protein [Limnofasciculus baicalensis]MCP2728949.1 hypothetical protein [Limnofasciculus baicalensis BBK-W-15]